MKLEHVFAAMILVGAVGCGGAVSAPVAPSQAVGTTHVTAADADDVPRIGTAHYSREDSSSKDSKKDDAAGEPTKSTARHGARRGGGFSGYK